MLVGQTIGSPEKGQLHIDKELGSGAMGTVYRATMTRPDGGKQLVALKLVSLGLLGNESAMARFNRESAILKQLRHPHIVRLIGVGRYRGTPYIAMEFVDGEPLDRVLARRGRLGWEEVLEYARQLCDALHHAHEKGIIHRDLKPSNLMITVDGVLKLTDFGIAKDTDVTALTAANNTIGTAAYMSPEQCRGSRELTPKSDLYSLGVVAYELITGKKPFYADNSMEMFLKHVNETAVRPGKLVPDLPVWVDNLVMHLMEKAIDTRPLDAATVGKMIREIVDKVQQHKSAGLEVATARKIDRKLNAAAEATDEDREAARALKGKGKKKKRKRVEEATPLLQRTWVKAVGLGTLLLALVGGGVWYSLPPGIDKAYEAVAATGNVDTVRQFLKDYGRKDHPKVDEARAKFKDLRTRQAEDALVKRYGTDDTKLNRRKPDDGETKEVMDAIWNAMTAEKAGKLADAKAHWEYVQKEVPDVEAGRYADEDATRIPVYRWVAEKRLGELKAVDGELARLKRAAAAGYDDEQPKSGDKDFEAKAIRALRLEGKTDQAKAHKVWGEVASGTAADPDAHVPHLLAVQRQADTGPPEKGRDKEKEWEAEAVKNRQAVAAKLLDDVTKGWESVKGGDPVVEQKARRDVRVACRELIDLYGDEKDDEVKKAVDAAKQVLEEAK